MAATIELRNHVPTGVCGASRIFEYPSVLRFSGRNVRSACDTSAVDFSDVVTIHSSGVRKSSASTPRKIALHGTRDPLRGSGAAALAVGGFGGLVVVVLIASSPSGCALAGTTE